jgi:trimethylamine--corrinoid protein Co-methyltransferase
MSRTQWLEVLSDEQILHVHHSSLELLEQTGVCIPHQQLLELCRDHGAWVDFRRQVVRFPAFLVERALKGSPSSFTWHGRNPQHDIRLGEDKVYYLGASTLVTVYDLDGVRRPATFEDVKRFSRLKDALEHVDDGYGAVHPQDVPETAAHCYQMIGQFTSSEKPFRARMFGRQVAEDCLRMAQIVAGGEEAFRQRPNLLVVINTVSPLTNTPEQMEALVVYAEANAPVFLSPQIQAGATGPVTLAGLLIQMNAEILAGITAAQLVNPGCRVGYGTTSGIMDMRQGLMPYATPESALINIATAQMARFYRLPSRGTGGFTEAHVLDMQAGFETALTTVAAALAGIHIIIGAAGSLQNALGASYAKFVVDNEIIGYIKRITSGIEFTPETMALDAIKHVGPAGHFLTEDHTVRHFRNELYRPLMSSREAYEQWETQGGKTIDQKATEEAERILREHQPAPLPPEVEKELWAVVRIAESRQQ